MKSAWPSICFCLALTSVSAADKPLRIAIDAAWNSPQIIQKAGQPSAGIFYDLFAQIGRNAEARIEWKVLPRKRLVAAIEQNEADLLCHINPKWITQPLPAERWSGLFIQQENVIIQPPNRPLFPINLAQPSHLNLGTVLGFHYPKLEEHIKRGIIRRIDSPNQAVLLENTRNGKLAYSIINRLNVDDFNRLHSPAQRLTILQTVDIQDTFCLIAPQPQIPAPQIKAAIAQLHSARQAEAILQRYRSEKNPRYIYIKHSITRSERDTLSFFGFFSQGSRLTQLIFLAFSLTFNPTVICRH